MNSKGITVNGVMLEEYVKDTESIEEQTEREKLINENSPKNTSYSKPRERFKPTNEPNGKVKVLSQREINEIAFEEELSRELKSNDYKRAIVIFFMGCGWDDYFSQKQMRDEIKSIAEKRGIKLVKHLQPAIERQFIKLRKSQFFTDFLEKKSIHPIRYKLSDFALESYDFKTAIRLSDLPYTKEFSSKKAVTPEPTPFERVPPKQELPKQESTETAPSEITARKFDLDGVVKRIISASREINFSGDIHIHINIK